MAIELNVWQQEVYRNAMEQLGKHKQAAIELFTSGGKTYIAGKIIEKYIEDNPRTMILWVSSRSAVDNVSSGYFDAEISKHITFATFGDIERYGIDNEEDRYNSLHKEYELIIIDEAHRALAYYAYIGICRLRQIHSEASLVAMTATPKRHSDGRNAFEELTPLATPCGIPLREAVRNKLVTEMNYRVCNTQVLRQDYAAINEYRKVAEKYGIFRTQIDVLQQYLDEFQFSLKESAIRVLEQHNIYDGTEGDRWMVFFSTIAALQSLKSEMEEVFSRVYEGKKVRVLEYHGGNTKQANDKTLEVMTAEATPNTIDVILTVEKGGESVHPKNIRGILMYRCTHSDRIYQQQLGRAIKIRNEDSGNKPVIILDFVNNVSIVGGDTLGIGYRGLSARPEKSKRIPSIDEITERIRRIDNDNQMIDIKVGDPVLAEYLEVSQSMREIMPWMVIWDKISCLIDKAPKFRSVYDMIKSSTKYTDEEKRILKRWFRDNQQKYMSGDFDEFNPDKKAYFDIAGCYAYMTADISNAAKRRLYILEKIASYLDEIEYDYSRLDEVTGLREQINKFRSMYASEALESAEVIYCRRNGIDVELKEELTDADIKSLCKRRNSSRLVRMYINISTIIKNKKRDGKEITYDDFVDIHSALLTFKRTELHTLGMALYSKLHRECNDELGLYKVDPDDMSEALDLLTVVDKVKNNQPLTVFDEDLIFRGLDNFDVGLSSFTRRMLNMHGITRYNYSRRLGNKTPWMQSYQKVIEGGDPKAYASMKGYNPGSIPTRLKKLEKSKKFKEVEQVMGQEIQSEIIRKMVQMAYKYETSIINDIESRVKNGFSPSRVLSYAFPDFAEDIAYRAFRKQELTDTEKETIKGVVESSIYMTRIILQTLSECKFAQGKDIKEVLIGLIG